MSDRLWIVFGALAGIAFAVQVALPINHAERPETTFETAPRGHAAVFELLEHFGSTRGRWLSGVSMPSPEDTIWWIAPRAACDSDAPAADEDQARRADEVPFRVIAEPWIEAGGTAVVWLSPPPLPSASPEDRQDAESIREGWRESLQAARRSLREGEPSRCRSIAGVPLPQRVMAGLEGGALPLDVDASATLFSVGRWVEQRDRFDFAGARSLAGPTLAFFEKDDERLEGWQPLWVEADDDLPFALERQLGAGRLVVVADARVLINGRLGTVDAAPFVFDWVEDFGAPWIDEHGHGVVPESGSLRYLMMSPAWAAGLGLLALGAVVIWRGHAWPPRSVDEVDPDAPTLAAFVDSVARLYAGTPDHQQVFERYRALSLARIRRVLGLFPGAPNEEVLAVLEASVSSGSAPRQTGLRDLLASGHRIEDAAALQRAVGRLDAFVALLREASRNRDAPAGIRNRGSRG